MHKNRHINIPVFVPHRGCPHTCVFCDQRKISGTREALDPQKVKALLEESVSTIGPDDFAEIAFFGGSFTGIPEPEMIAYLEAARPYLESEKVRGIRLSTRPDYISPRIIDILKAYGVTAIELGVQSLDNGVLALSQRGHTAEDVEKACKLIKQSGIKLGVQIMLGLPGDSFEKTLKTAYGVLDLKPDMVRIYPVLVLKNTVLETLYNSGEYSPLSIEEAVDRCAAILPLFKDKNITVLRIGLHAAETLEESVVAGPYHPAFGELVESRILYGKLVEKLDAMNIHGCGEIVVRTRPELISKLIGQKKSNINAIKNRYALSDVKVLEDPEVESFEIQVKKEKENEDN
jgi:histone acetyltransferase (RNA polymerase elongator complex component)